MNRLKHLFDTKGDKNLLSIYYTAGYPDRDATLSIAQSLQEAGVDFLEIGFPYSDPVADGPIIQHSSAVALKKGMTLELLFEQLKELRKTVHIPVLLMGYFNPVLQYGVQNFLEQCARVGIDGVIIPDLPLYEYEERYAADFKQNGVYNVFLVTPQTDGERIRKIDQLSEGFIYLLSSSATTGKNLSVGEQSEIYFKRIKEMNLKNPIVVGFGISDRTTFLHANQYADAAIIGSAFVQTLAHGQSPARMLAFVKSIKGLSAGGV